MITEQMTAVAASGVNEQLSAVSPSGAAFKCELQLAWKGKAKAAKGGAARLQFSSAREQLAWTAASCASATYSS